MRTFIIFVALALLSLLGFSQEPQHTAPVVGWDSDGQTLTSQSVTWLKVRVERILQKRSLTPADYAGIHKYHEKWGHTMSPSVESGLILMLQLDIIHLPIYLDRTPQEIDLAYQIVDQLMKRVDLFVNIPVQKSRPLPEFVETTQPEKVEPLRFEPGKVQEVEIFSALKPVELPEAFKPGTLPEYQPLAPLKLESGTVQTVGVFTALPPIEYTPFEQYKTEVAQLPAVVQVIRIYTQQACSSPPFFQARYPGEAQGPSFQGQIGLSFVPIWRQPNPASAPPATPPCPPPPPGTVVPQPPPGASNLPVSGPTIVCPLPPGSNTGGTPPTQPGFIQGGVGA